MGAIDIAGRLEALGLPEGSNTVKPHDRPREVIARRMTESTRDVLRFPLDTEIALDALLAARAARNGGGGATKLSVNGLVMKAAAVALIEAPARLFG